MRNVKDPVTEMRTKELCNDIITYLNMQDIPIRMGFVHGYGMKSFGIKISNLKAVNNVENPEFILFAPFIQEKEIDNEFHYMMNSIGVDNNYFKLLGIDLNDYNYIYLYYIFGLLQQLGHINTYLTFDKNNFGAIKTIDKIIRNTLWLYKPPKNRNEELDLRAKQYDELFANNFAFKYFPIIWNNINNIYDYYFKN